MYTPYDHTSINDKQAQSDQRSDYFAGKLNQTQARPAKQKTLDLQQQADQWMQQQPLYQLKQQSIQHQVTQ